MNTKLVNELNEMITKLTAMRDNLDPTQHSSNRAAMFSGKAGQTPVREFPKNEALESQGVTKPQTWGDHTTFYYHALILHRHPGIEQTQLPARVTLRDPDLITLIGMIDQTVSELQEEGDDVFKIAIELHSGLKESHKQNNTGDAQ